MEEEWDIGEDEWVTGEIIAPGGGESPPLFEQVAGAISLPTPPMEEERAIGELEAPGGREEPPPLSDQPTAPPPPPLSDQPTTPLPGLSVVEGYATAAAATAALIRNKRGRVPASSKAIRGLREVTEPPTDDCCAICLQDFDFHPDPAETPPSDLRLRAMPCSHTFHEHCIFEWLRRDAACPLCCHQLPMEEDQGRRRRRSRVVYNERDGRYYVPWYVRDQVFAGDE
ncbi:unnamed protein product [Urochloa decumbens]|uniref:RING-type domain-containing protein n=1 Tax=Urochloa decumbens TaxID=240449 RepID=A0ABC9B660_9POAL